MKLHYFPPSPNTRKVQAVIHHLDLRVDLEMVNLVTGEQKKPEYTAINSNQKTPTLQDGDFTLWESEAIMQYLAGQNIYRWQCWQLAHWGPACGILIYERVAKKFFGGGDPDPAEVTKGEEGFHRYASILNQHLKDRRWIVGDNVTLADFSVGAAMTYAEPAQFPLESYGEIRRWSRTLDELDAWKKAAPPQRN